jgi:hypothetical protein
MTAQTPAQRKAAERARDAAADVAEVRGIKAPTKHHAKIKAAARRTAAELAAKEKTP